MLLQNGADSNAANLKGQTPLMEAAKNGMHEIIAILLQYGAEVKETDTVVKTAIQYLSSDVKNADQIPTSRISSDYDDIKYLANIYPARP